MPGLITGALDDHRNGGQPVLVTETADAGARPVRS